MSTVIQRPRLRKRLAEMVKGFDGPLLAAVGLLAAIGVAYALWR